MASAAKFARVLTAETTVYLGFAEVTIRELNFMYSAGHGTDSKEVRIGDTHRESLLDDIEASFIEPTNPVLENHVNYTTD